MVKPGSFYGVNATFKQFLSSLAKFKIPSVFFFGGERDQVQGFCFSQFKFEFSETSELSELDFAARVFTIRHVDFILSNVKGIVPCLCFVITTLTFCKKNQTFNTID